MALARLLLVETDPPYLLHLEFLVGHDAAVQPRKLHKRNLLLEDRHDLAVRTVLVLLRQADDSPVLTGLRQRTFHGEPEPYPWFRYGVLRVWQVPAALLLAGGPRTLPLAPLGAVTEGELQALSVRLLNASSWHDLLAQPAPRRRKGRRRPEG